MNTEITTLLAQGYTCVTPTKRLSHYLQSQYAALQIEAGKQAWETPEILSWGGWLHQLWEDSSTLRQSDQYVLKPHQQQSVWQQIIGTSRYAKQLLRPETTAKQAMAAWSLCYQWKLPLFSDAVYLNEDARAFQSWAKEYEKQCKKNAWIDDAMLATQITDDIKQLGKKVHQKIILLGFDEFTPQQQALFNALTNAETTLQELPLIHRNEHILALGFTDVREEIKAAANWSRQLLETEPHHNIGIIVPNLQTLHRQLENIFDDVLIPAAIVNSPETMERPYSIAQGLPLNSYPLIDAALAILSLANTRLSFGAIASLLRSPFTHAANEERVQRAALAAHLHEHGEQQLSISAVLHRASHEKLNDHRPDQFLDALHQWQKAFKELPDKKTGHQWAQTFTELLNYFNWPGDRKLTSAEYQTVEAWQELISQFASLDLVSSTLSYREALTKLNQLASNHSYQPETKEVPIQIVAMTGAAGMQFDHLWVMGLDEEVWPAKADPNPFIPFSMQRGAKLPNATAETKLAQAELLTQRLVSSASNVILSYAQNDKERPQRSSALIKPYLRKEKSISIAKIAAYTTQIFKSQQLEKFNDDNATAIKSREKVSGGASLFKDQAACPFRATARHRLFAYGLPIIDIGLNAMDRGLILHQVMQILWQQLGGQKELIAKDNNELDIIIKSAISLTLDHYAKKQPGIFTQRFTQLESERLHTLTKEWLTIERERQPFSVHACEEEHIFTFNKIEVRTRIDRIDKLENGQFVIIDYKTGDPKLAAWFDERPDEPQLPLYAVTSKGDIGAIVFAKIKRGESTYIGLSASDNILPNVKTLNETRLTQDINDWESLLSQWQDTLSQLASAFREGDARVDPKGVTTCQYCDLHALCRIYELNTENTEQEVANE